MAIGDVNEQEYCFNWCCSWIGSFILVMLIKMWGYHFGDVNKQVYFSNVIKLGQWQLVMLMTGVSFQLVMFMDRVFHFSGVNQNVGVPFWKC